VRCVSEHLLDISIHKIIDAISAGNLKRQQFNGTADGNYGKIHRRSLKKNCAARLVAWHDYDNLYTLQQILEYL